MRHIRLFESFKEGESGLYEVLIKVKAVEPDGNWDNPGNWDIHEYSIKVITTSKDEVEALKNISKGDYLTDDEFYCDEVKEVFSKDNLSAIALLYDGSIEDFADTLQEQVYDATLDYYMENFTVDTEDEDYEGGEVWNGDGINDDALKEITYDEYNGYSWSFKEISDAQFEEFFDKLTDGERGIFAKYHPNLSPEEKRIFKAIGLNSKRS